jgi:hypothetical protein
MPHPEKSSDRRANRLAAGSPAEAWLMSCNRAGGTLVLNAAALAFPGTRGVYRIRRTPAEMACVLPWLEMSPSSRR